MARVLGTAIPRDEAAAILRALEFEVTEADDGLDAKVPAFRRSDVTREADLIEEVARLWGLEKLPATLPSRRGATGVLAPAAAAAPPGRGRARRRRPVGGLRLGVRGA